jgi:predicted dehydrogenase
MAAVSRRRIAILGLDHWYWAYGLADAAHQMSGVQIVGIWDDDPGKRASAARIYGAQAFESPDEALARGDVGSVVITSTTDRHVDLAVPAARAGKAIICNKPLGRTLQEARTIADAVEAAGVPFQSIEQGWRYFAAFARARKALASGMLGRVLTVNTVTRAAMPSVEEGSVESGWFTDPAKTAGGAFIDHGVYSLDLVSWLVDSPVDEVTHAEVLHANDALSVEDYGLAVIRLANGALGTVEETWFSPTFSITLEVRGTEGELTAQVGRAPALYLRTRAEGPTVIEDMEQETYGPALAAFLAAIERGEDTSRRSLRMMELCCRAYSLAAERPTSNTAKEGHQ